MRSVIDLRWGAASAALALLLAACGSATVKKKEAATGGLSVQPPSAEVPIFGRQPFAASVRNVTWSVREGDAGGRITSAGVYTAPGAPGSFTVVAEETVTGMQAVARVTVVDSAPSTSHGLSIPVGHPKLWFNPGNIEAARAWYAAHPFTPLSGYQLETALRGLLADDSAQCTAAINSALSLTQSVPLSGTACDDCRWMGERIIATYDWCYGYMTTEQRSTFVSATNAWINFWRTAPWGSPPGHQGNYYWGYLRNELQWAIASYHENTELGVCSTTQTCPEVFLDDVLTRRLADDFYPAAAPGGDSVGGVGQEGSAYGTYVAGYMAMPLGAAGFLGRNLYDETNYWREAVYALIYMTSSTPTTRVRADGSTQSMGYTIFPFGDDQLWLNGSQLTPNYDKWIGNAMLGAASRWYNLGVGRHARQYLNTTGATTERFLQAVDPGGTSADYSSLPLDYYAAGSTMFYARSSWSSGATSILMQLADPIGRNGHPHQDWGTWQVWRGGRHLSRETVGYGDPIAGYGGSGTANSGHSALGHNAVLINGAGIRSDSFSVGNAVVGRVEHRSDYAFAAVNLTPTRNNSAFVNWQRDFVFVRGLETLVILDRLQSSSAGATKTFLAHSETSPSPATGSGATTITNGGSSLVITTLVPAQRSHRVVTEGGVGQYRIEVDTTPGTEQSYILTVLQAKDASATALSPTVTEDDAGFTVTLDGSNSLVLAKGMSSTGGSITTSAGTSAFGAGIQGVTVTDDGPLWE